MIGQEEKESILKLTPFFNNHPVVFDVGSNKGGFADVILEEYGEKCSIHLFEPNTKLLSYTEVKYEYRRNVIFNKEGVYRFSGVLDFYYFENYNNELSSLVKSDDWGGLPMKTKGIHTTTIDKYCDENNISFIDCLKVDVEGCDPDVIIGAKNMFDKGLIMFCLVEYSPHYQRANNKFQLVIDRFKDTGYKIYEYINGNFCELTQFIEDYSFRNFVITKQNIHNYSLGWNVEFIKNTAALGMFDFMLEVGCYEGLTTKYMCENMLNRGRVICVDPLENYYTETDTEHREMFIQQYQRFIGNTKGLPVELVRKKSDIALPEMHEFRFGFIFIDGDHSEHTVYTDGKNCFAICKVGGYILFDDYIWRDETKRGIDRFLSEYQGLYHIVETGYQLLIKKIKDKID